MSPEVVVARPGEPLPGHWDAAIFLAGPTPRGPEVASWRPEAVDLLERRWRGGRLVVCSPEPPEGFHPEYTDQIEWEERALACADVIAFWVPRDPRTLPALTTNIEWGAWRASGKAVFGAPPDAPNNGYLHHYARAHRVPAADTLAGTLEAALAETGPGARREDGEREVPLLVWRTASFQRWYAELRRAGHVLEGARVVWTFRAGPEPSEVMHWALRARVRFAGQARSGPGQTVVSGPETARVVLYVPAEDLDDTAVALVRRFRASASAPDGCAHELPGGDSAGAAREALEEAGLSLEADRLRELGTRPLAVGAVAHRASLAAAQVTGAELDRLRARPDRAGDTWIEVTTYGALRRSEGVDWSTLGMVAAALTERPGGGSATGSR